MARVGTLAIRGGRWAMLAAATGLLAAPAAYGAAKPVITGLAATPSTVASGGTITVSASVSEATGCTLSANKPVTGLPATFSCESGTVDREVVMPQNLGKKAAKYKLSLVAVGPGGNSKKAKLTVLVGTPSAQSIAAGDEESCAVLTTGHVKCWGYNAFGQLGYGKRKETSDVPVEVKGLTGVAQVAVGSLYACALQTGGHVECWGANQEGQLGDGTTTDTNVPVEVSGLSGATELSAGAWTTCVLLEGGHVSCWGSNKRGELGPGIAGTNSTHPVEIEGITGAISVAVSSEDVCVVLASHHVLCSGDDLWGELGNGTHGKPSSEPVEVAGITSAEQVAGSGSHMCAVLSDGKGSCWGENYLGDLGTGSATGPESCGGYECSTLPVGVVGLEGASTVAAGRRHTCSLLQTKSVLCWGSDESGQLGNGSRGPGSPTPVEVSGLSGVIEISTGIGSEHTCALLSTGHIKCWGLNTFGQLGNGAEHGGETPVEVVGI